MRLLLGLYTLYDIRLLETLSLGTRGKYKEDMNTQAEEEEYLRKILRFSPQKLKIKTLIRQNQTMRP